MAVMYALQAVLPPLMEAGAGQVVAPRVKNHNRP